MMGTAHLTDEHKRRELTRWAGQRDDGTYRGPGGSGFPDPEVFDMCDQLNALRGVCTMQSCAGHRRTADQGWSSPGNVWLWLSDDTFTRFVDHADLLARHDFIDRVEIKFGLYRDARAVVSITFAGQDRAALGRSTAVVVGFFASIARTEPCD